MEEVVIRLVVADDHPDMMQAIRRLCDSYDDVQIVAEGDRLEALQAAALSHAHDVILMDDYLPSAIGSSKLASLRETGITTPILVMSMFREADRIRSVLEAGASGYVVKEEFIQELGPAIRTVYGGERYLSPWAVAALEGEEE